MPFLCIAVVAIIGAKLYLDNTHAQTPAPGVTTPIHKTCAVSNILVNPCHPLLGAAVGGDPHAASTSKTTQMEYLEKLVGRPLDIYHDYHPIGNIPMNADEAHFAARANTYDYINWKPASTWAAASGNNASVNASIKQAADNIKANGHKVFLTVWHEPENDVSGFDSSAEQSACKASGTFKGFKGSAGTPAQYRAMWQNVRNIFNREGVSNVVWVINYQNYKPWQCLVPYMYPGNGLVDWVTFESYASGSDSFQAKINDMYSLLQKDSSATNNFESKPWGIGEFNDCNDDPATAAQKLQGLKSVIDANTFPRLHMYMVFDSANGPGGTANCLVDRTTAEQGAFKSLADDPVFTSTNNSGGNPGSSQLQVTLVSPSDNATVSKTAVVTGQTNSAAAFASLRIDNQYVTGVHNPSGTFTLRYNSTKLKNGNHQLLLRVWDSNGHYLDTKPVTIRVRN